jgi:hypothetical protein
LGAIKCLRTIAPLAAGDEVYVAYGYEVGQVFYAYGLAGKPAQAAVDAPRWFLEQLESHLCGLGHRRRREEDEAHGALV